MIGTRFGSGARLLVAQRLVLSLTVIAQFVVASPVYVSEP